MPSLRRTPTLLAGILVLLAVVAPAQDQPAASTSNSIASTLQDALGSYRKGSFEQAIAKYNEALKADPQSGEAWAGLVRSYLKQDKIPDAADTLQKALSAKPSDPQIRVAQGELLFRQGKIVESEKAFVEAANSGQKLARAYLGIARVAEAISMHAREHAFLVRAHEADPSDPEIQKEWMYTLSRAERIAFLESYLGHPNSDDGRTNRSLREYLEFMKAAQAKPHASCRLASKVAATETELLPLLADAYHLRGLGLPVTIDGRKSKLMLDTGAGGIAINRKLAEKAGLQRFSDTHVGGIGDKGDVGAYVAYANSIRIGNLEFQNCPVLVVDRRSVAEEEGLIGATVFSKFLVEIDFPKRKLRLNELPRRPGEEEEKVSLVTSDDDDEDEKDTRKAEPQEKPRTPAPPKYFDRYIAPEMASYTRVFRFGHMLLIPTKMNDTVSKLFLIDSGAFNNTITPAAAREVTKVRGSNDFFVKGISGEVNKVYETDEINLEFGHLRQRMRDMVAFDLSQVSRSAGTEISGTLGFAMLNLLTLKIDYRDGLVDFVYVHDPRIE